MSRSRPAITTPFFDAWLTGGLSILGMGSVLVWLLLFGGEVAFADADWIALTILINSTHFLASYRLLYTSREAIRAHRWSTLYVPATLLATLVLAATSPQRDLVYAQLVFLSSVYLAWHYTGQAWGMVSVASRLTGVDFTARERAMIRFGMRTLLALHVLYALAGRLPPAAWIEPALYIRLYGWAFYGVCGLAVASLFVGGVAFAIARRRTGRLPARAVLPWAALYLWYPFWYFVPGGFLFVQLSHALQYLAFPLRVEVNRYAEQAPRTARARRLRAVVVYAGLVVAGGLVLNGAPLAARIFGEGWYSTADARAIFMAFTNCVAIHHYFVDGAIWKLRSPKVRHDLFSHLGEKDGAIPR
ncbi:MAG: hypothetical protein IPK00_18065 [Deltaproteobacteria bacterium]|nr:hypothetical protein [Deltaproteobacteria bacterium]